MTYIREQAIRGLKAGDVFTVTRTFTENDTVAFGEISRDMNPIHYDERFAAAKDFRGKICHGLLVGGMITEVGGKLAGWHPE
ncbi:MaoC/PaaZ C-terminal domain-containing protein [Marinobacter sp. AC-23]|uniref:MaoC/PaaZ C-terminal domain-containing protein n=1 Tax=Marinobacter sp. AC-23 TaxID=1879031 RepID=UPI0034A23B6B